jgi:hypothetical protein
MVFSDYICFPWLIVEHKKAGEVALEEKCYCQAANAGTAAIMMLETLSGIVPGVKEHKAHEHIPPVVTMTTVDKIVRVWITYSCKPSDNDAAKYVRKPLSSFSYLFLVDPLLTDCQEDGLHLERGHDICLRSHQVPSYS